MKHHLLLKAATTATDQGAFEAVISTASPDRDGDIVEPKAIAKSLAKWAKVGKLIPLAFCHRDPKTGHAVVVGHVDPASARVEGQEVIVKGFVDQSTDRGAETWRLVKSGTLSFSYGYLVPKGGQTKRPGRGAGYHITDIDLYEISVVPVAPANNDTRVLSWKAIADDFQAVAGQVEAGEAPSQRELAQWMRAMADNLRTADDERLRKQARDAEREQALDELKSLVGDDLFKQGPTGDTQPEAEDPADLLDGMLAMAQAFIDAEDDPADVDAMRDIADRIQALIGTEDAEDDTEEGGKAVWSASYVNSLPDSSFLYVEGGGSKDEEGKTTPRSLRHFPYKDAGGNVDLPHLRNALSRIPQSNLPQDVKDRLAARAQRILDGQKSAVEDAGEDPKVAKPAGEEPPDGKPKAQDPLRRRADETELEFLSGGVKARKSPPPERPKPELLPLGELKRRMREEMLTLLSGGMDE